MSGMLVWVGYILAALLLASCSAAPTVTPAPTTDLSALRTEVAATVLAQVPQICALTPSATALPTFTATTAPSATPTIEPSPTSGTPGTATATAATNDLAKYVSQTIPDGSVFLPGQAFTMVWRIQNVGTSTWTAGYRLRFFAGDAFGAPKEIALGKDVPPGDTVDITIEMKAPAKVGKYRSDWVMSNEVLRNFKEPLFLEINVANPTATPTSTRTPVPPTATVTPAS